MISMWKSYGIMARVATLILVAMFLAGGIVFAYQGVFGPLFADQSNDRFQHSTQHRDAVASDLGARCVELAQATDPVVRRAIEGVIYDRTNSMDLDSLDLAPDVRACVDTARTEYAHGR